MSKTPEQKYQEHEQRQEAFKEFNRNFGQALDSLFVPILRWLDRQLRRMPRLYAWLSR